MTTNTHLGNGMYVTSTTQGIISHCDVALTSASSPYTALAYDYIIRADATSGNITINLPTAVGIAGKEYHIFRTDIIASTNIITIDANSTETIDSNLTYRLYTGEWIKLESDGANWQVIGRPTPTQQNYYLLKGTSANRRLVAGHLNSASALITSTTSPAANTLWAFPLVIPKTTKCDKISFNITTASTSGNSRAGIYRDNGNNFPGVLIFDTGSVDTHTGSPPGLLSTTITSNLQIFQPGLYWLAYEQDTATGQMIILQTTSSCVNIMGFPMGATTPGYFYLVGHTFGALPDPYTVSATLTNTASAVGTPLPAVGIEPL